MSSYGKTPGSATYGIKRTFSTGLAETRNFDAEGLGAIRHEGNNAYKWVKYNNGTANIALAIGDVLSYFGVGGYSNNEVTADHSDGVNIGAGVAMSAPADGEYFWVQVKGVATIANLLTAGSDGNALTVAGAGDETLDVSAAASDFICAVALDASEKIILCQFPE